MGGAIICFTGYYVYGKVKSIQMGLHEARAQLAELRVENALLFEQYARPPRHLHLADSALDVLCLGNSITRHPVREEVEWYSDWGMAASCPEKDYCHVLEQKLRERNILSTVTPLNIAGWERNFSCNLDSLMGDWCKGKNLIVIRLGENVSDTEQFLSSLLLLIDYCKQYTRNIIVTGNFWRNPIKEKALMLAAHIQELPFVSLVWIAENYAVYPQIGDTLLDMYSKPYTIDHDFITTHPNDEGMRMIAEELYKAIN